MIIIACQAFCKTSWKSCALQYSMRKNTAKISKEHQLFLEEKQQRCAPRNFLWITTLMHHKVQFMPLGNSWPTGQFTQPLGCNSSLSSSEYPIASPLTQIVVPISITMLMSWRFASWFGFAMISRSAPWIERLYLSLWMIIYPQCTC